MIPSENLHYISDEIKRMREAEKAKGFDGGGGGGYDEGMETRVAKLEEFVVDARERLTKIETRLEQTATKADIGDIRVDMHKGFVDMTKWVVGTAVGMGAAGIVVMTFVLNNAVPKGSTPPPVQAQPIIIYAQPAPLTPASPAPSVKP